MATWEAPIATGRAARRGRRKLAWVREILSPAEAKARFPRLWDVADLLLAGLDEDRLARVVSIVVDTCPSCHEGDAGCRCRDRA